MIGINKNYPTERGKQNILEAQEVVKVEFHLETTLSQCKKTQNIDNPPTIAAKCCVAFSTIAHKEVTARPHS